MTRSSAVDREQSTGGPTEPRLLDSDVHVPLVGGGQVTYANLDYAASTPCLQAVNDRLQAVLPYYASVHRGAGYLSELSTELYEQARHTVHRFVGARDDDVLLFTRNTTDALNLLARALPRDVQVVVFDTEHHAGLLAWGSRRTTRLAPPPSPQAAVVALRAALRHCRPGHTLVCVSGASNVTGELWPVAELAATAHRYGARIAVDAAQVAGHLPVSMSAWDADYLALSGHKMYAPFGAGALVGRADWLTEAPPYLAGGGASHRVDAAGVQWAPLPHRHEGGSPNLVGAIALAGACEVLTNLDREALAARERRLADALRQGLADIPGVRLLRLWSTDHPHVGIAAFVVDGMDGALLATALSTEFGIGVRHGKFCAHPFVGHLTTATERDGGCATDGAVRASIGLGTTREHVNRLIAGVHSLTTAGPRWRYLRQGERYRPDPDPRPVAPPWLAPPSR